MPLCRNLYIIQGHPNQTVVFVTFVREKDENMKLLIFGMIYNIYILQCQYKGFLKTDSLVWVTL